MRPVSAVTVRTLIGLLVLGCGSVGCGGPGSEESEPNEASSDIRPSETYDRAGSLLPDSMRPAVGQPSALWGFEGERWSPRGQLPDFSHAGYRRGEVALPSIVVEPGDASGRVFDVRRYGAVGDGVTDDSPAFLAAIAAASEAAATEASPSLALGGGMAVGDGPGRHFVVFVPAGRYRLEQRLDLRQSRVVLRGQSRDGTVLYFPHSLHEIYGRGADGGPYGWSWGGAFVWARGELGKGRALTAIAEPAERGDTAIVVESTEGLEPGSWFRLVMLEAESGSLTHHLHADFRLKGPCQVEVPGQRLVHWSFRIAGIEGQRVALDRPLRFALRSEWRPQLHTFEPTLEEIGVEHLTVEFPATEQQPHHDEFGYNGIELQEVWNGWIRDVAVIHSDNAIQLWYSRNVTAQQILITGRGGHYGINLGGSQDCLATEFRLENVSIHDLSYSNLGNGSVFSRGEGPFVNFDFHRGAPYENLISDIDVGESWRGYRIWARSHTPSGHYTAARETFWNIRPKLIFAFTPAWPAMLQIGPMPKTHNLRRANLGFWLEPIHDLTPRDLHAAQLTRRLGRWPEALSADALDVRVPPRPSEDRAPATEVERAGAKGE